MIDTKVNNWLLPLKGEDIENVDYVLSLGVIARAKLEPAIIFNDMQKRFWTEHFIDQSAQRLLSQARTLGLTQKKLPKGELVYLLVDHFRKVIN